MVSTPLRDLINSFRKDDHMWAIASLELEGGRPYDKDYINQRVLRQVEEEAYDVRIQEGEGQAYSFQNGPGMINVYFRTYHLVTTGIPCEDTIQACKRLENVPRRNTFELTEVKGTCGRPRTLDKRIMPSGTKWFRTTDNE